VAARNKPRCISDLWALNAIAETCGTSAVPAVTLAHPTGSGQGQTAQTQVMVRSPLREPNRHPLPITE